MVEQIDYDKMADEIVETLNKIREKPDSIIMELKKMKNFYKGNEYRNPKFNFYIMTEEGKAAVDDAIKYLGTIFTNKPFERVKALDDSAKELVDHLGPEGLTNAKEKEMSIEVRVKEKVKEPGAIAENISFGWPNAREIVLQMIIDDGVPSRGHRLNLFNSNYEKIGVSVGKHKTFQCVCVLDFWGKGKKDKLKFEKYEIDKGEWPENAVGLQKHLEAKSENGKKKILLTYTFSLSDGTTVVKTKNFEEDL